MTYLDLIRDADRKIDNGNITLGEYEEMIEPLKREIQPERKKGKWIHGREMAREMIRDCTTAIFYEGWTCSECGCLVEKEREPWYKYCPNCGSFNGGAERNESLHR